ncbi:MAG: hypothetical protein JWN69_2075 [Alphaproteobacteria bacterium]|nr:hypothetical protein [Alphaproteobacteria bacterium]
MLALSLLSGCMRSEDEFLIKVEGAPADKAVLYLDGPGVELPAVEGGFRGVHDIRRDSSGVIIVYLRERPPVVCDIGYTTNGLSAVWRFRVDTKHEDCQAVGQSPVVPHDRPKPER